MLQTLRDNPVCVCVCGWVGGSVGACVLVYIVNLWSTQPPVSFVHVDLSQEVKLITDFQQALVSRMRGTLQSPNAHMAWRSIKRYEEIT